MRILFAGFILFLFNPIMVHAECDGRLVDEEFVFNAPVCLPDNPQRIITLDPTFSLGMALELGLPVVGAPLFAMSDETLKEKALAAGVTDLGHFAEPSLEKIVALKPDLIVGAGGLGETVYNLASRFAPTALITAGGWKKYYRILAGITGTDPKVDEWLASYEERLADVRARVPDVRVSVIRITSWDFQVYSDAPNAYAPFAILRDAGVKRTDYETSTSETVALKRPDWEQLANLDGDILLYIVGGTNDSDTNGRLEEVLGNPLWKALPAVKAGRVYRIDPATWMEFSGVASAHRVLDDIERYIIGGQ